jgi:hypothetical protein
MSDHSTQPAVRHIVVTPLTGTLSFAAQPPLPLIAAAAFKAEGKSTATAFVVRANPSEKPALRSPEVSHAPKNATYLLYLFIPKINREAILGDYEEDYPKVVLEFGRRKAEFWYWKDVLFTIAWHNPLIRRLLSGAIAKATEWLWRHMAE